MSPLEGRLRDAHGRYTTPLPDTPIYDGLVEERFWERHYAEPDGRKDAAWRRLLAAWGDR